MKILYITLSCLLFVFSVAAQKINSGLPEKLSAAVNSNAEELSPFLSDSGNKLYFVRGFHEDNVGGEYAGMDIWMTEKDSIGNWIQSNNKLSNWNNDENNAIIGIRNDQQTIYLLNGYFSREGIAFSKQRNNKWIKPELIQLKWLERKEFVGYYVSEDFDFMLISMKSDDSFGKEDLYISLKDDLGEWSKPKNLGSTINTSGFEISPFMSKDKKYLFFASDGHDGFGDADIYVSERLYDSWDVWSRPTNLGEPINSEKFDAYFSFYDSVALFSSNRDSNLSDIYQVKLNRDFNSDFLKGNVVRKNFSAISDEEITEIFGFKPSMNLSFDSISNELTLQSNELIYYLVKKCINTPKYSFRIIFSYEFDNELEILKKREKMILEKFLENRLSAERLLFQYLKDEDFDYATRIEIIK